MRVVWKVQVALKYFVKKSMRTKKNYASFQNSLGYSFPLFSNVAKWTNGFKFGWESAENYPHNGWPRFTTFSEMIAEVHNIILEDHQLKLRENAEVVGISSEWVLSHFVQ